MRRQLVAGTLATAASLTMIAVLPSSAEASTTAASHANRVRLDGRQEVPGPGDRNGSGTFVYRVRDGRLCYFLSVRKIRPATMAHIHKGKKGVAGPIVITLNTPSKGFSRGCVKAVGRQTAKNAATTLTKSELRAIVKWPHLFYANVHNKRFPAGAVRGQLD